MDCRDNVGNAPSVQQGLTATCKDWVLLAARRESQSMKVGRMSSWSEEGRVIPAYVAGDVTLGEVTPQRGKGTLGHGGRGKMSRHSGLRAGVSALDGRAEQRGKPWA